MRGFLFLGVVDFGINDFEIVYNGVPEMFQSKSQDFVIEKGDKFALLTIFRASVEIKENIEIDKDFWILQKSPITIINHWKDWLGSMQIEEIEKAELIIISIC